jgi:hypothetical protein
MGRYTFLAMALMFVGCAKSKSADKSPVEPGSSGSTATLTSPTRDEATRDQQTRESETTKETGAATIEDTAAHAPLPPDDMTPKGGNDQASGGGGGGSGSKNTESVKPKDVKELGKSSAALGTTDHGELFDQLAVKVESAKLGAKASTDLSTAVAAKTSDLDACYANARKANAKLAGSIELVFSVDADGNISSVTVKSSSVKNKALEACVKNVTKLVKLDKSLISAKTTKASVVIAFGS